jgi:AP endonuclease-1
MPALRTHPKRLMARTLTGTRSMSQPGETSFEKQLEKVPQKKAQISNGDSRTIYMFQPIWDSRPFIELLHETAEPVAKIDDFLSRIDTPWKIGAHVSSAGGVENAVRNAARIGYFGS